MTVSNPRCGCQDGALGGARLPLDLAHLVHVDERVEIGQVDAGEGAPHGEALALEPAGRGGHRPHGAVDGDGGVGLGDPRQHEDVVDGDGGHGVLLGVGATPPTCLRAQVFHGVSGRRAPRAARTWARASARVPTTPGPCATGNDRRAEEPAGVAAGVVPLEHRSEVGGEAALARVGVPGPAAQLGEVGSVARARWPCPTRRGRTRRRGGPPGRSASRGCR